MVTAKELRKISSECADVMVDKKLTHLMHEIEIAAKAGYNIYRTTNEVFRKELVQVGICNKLAALGFQAHFELGSLYSGPILTIKW